MTNIEKTANELLVKVAKLQNTLNDLVQQHKEWDPDLRRSVIHFCMLQERMPEFHLVDSESTYIDHVYECVRRCKIEIMLGTSLLMALRCIK